MIPNSLRPHLTHLAWMSPAAVTLVGFSYWCHEQYLHLSTSPSIAEVAPDLVQAAYLFGIGQGAGSILGGMLGTVATLLSAHGTWQALAEASRRQRQVYSL